MARKPSIYAASNKKDNKGQSFYCSNGKKDNDFFVFVLSTTDRTITEAKRVKTAYPYIIYYYIRVWPYGESSKGTRNSLLTEKHGCGLY